MGGVVRPSVGYGESVNEWRDIRFATSWGTWSCNGSAAFLPGGALPDGCKKQIFVNRLENRSIGEETSTCCYIPPGCRNRFFQVSVVVRGSPPCLRDDPFASCCQLVHKGGTERALLSLLAEGSLSWYKHRLLNVICGQVDRRKPPRCLLIRFASTPLCRQKIGLPG